MVIKMNFTLPEAVAARLKAEVRDRERSAFVAEAILNRLGQVEAARLEKESAEGYRVTAAEAAAVNAEWSAVALEAWPDAVDDR